MSALQNNIVQMPKQDRRKAVFLPFAAVTDKRMTPAALHVLAVLCAYCGKDGTTWVSQSRLAEDLGISRQAITNQMAKLKELGYVVTEKKATPGHRNNMVRVIFDEVVIDRPALPQPTPEVPMQDDEIDREGQLRIARMIQSALRKPAQPTLKTMPQSGETIAVRQAREAMRASELRKKQANQPVDNSGDMTRSVSSEGDIRTRSVSSCDKLACPIPMSLPIDNLKAKARDKVFIHKVGMGHLSLPDIAALSQEGLTEADIAAELDLLLPIYKDEGITPTSAQIADHIRDLRHIR